jgi:AraC-like DNA-binding protein
VIESSNLLIALCERIVSWGVARKDRDSGDRSRLVATFYDELEMARVADELPLPYPSTKRLRVAADKIIAGPNDRGSVATWAKFCGMSLRSFSALFAAETGMPFATWRQFIRLQAAVKMLRQNQSVVKVAADLGYSSSSAFVEIFRKHYGMPPKQYVKMILQKVSATVLAIGAPYLMKMGVQLSYLVG